MFNSKQGSLENAAAEAAREVLEELKKQNPAATAQLGRQLEGLAGDLQDFYTEGCKAGSDSAVHSANASSIDEAVGRLRAGLSEQQRVVQIIIEGYGATAQKARALGKSGDITKLLFAGAIVATEVGFYYGAAEHFEARGMNNFAIRAYQAAEAVGKSYSALKGRLS